MAALDEFVTRAREQNGQHHHLQHESLNDLSNNVRQTFANVNDTLQGTSARMHNHGAACRINIDSLQDNISSLSKSIQTPLAELQANLESNPLIDYVATGETPQKKDWTYPTHLPCTRSHDSLLAQIRGLTDAKPAAARSARKIASPRKTASPRKGFSSPSKLPSPTKTRIFHDDSAAATVQVAPTTWKANDPAEEIKGGLKEVDMNVLAQASSAGDLHGQPSTSFAKSINHAQQQPPLKRHATTESRLPRKGRENSVLAQSIGPGSGMGRRLRSSPQQ